MDIVVAMVGVIPIIQIMQVEQLPQKEQLLTSIITGENIFPPKN